MNRRELLAAGAAASSAASASAQPAPPSMVAEDLTRYAGFGNKRSGGAGDRAVGAWLEARLRSLGYTVRRQSFPVPYFEPATAALRLGAETLPVVPQAPWRPTPAEGVEGRLMRWPGPGEPRGRIAVIVLPFARWSALRQPQIEQPLRSALAAGAAAVIIVTTGPSGEALALNVDLAAPTPAAPVAILSPRSAASLLARLDAAPSARLTVTGDRGERQAYNVIATLERGAGRRLVISTPRSGWFACAGERGTGMAAWLALAGWAASARLPVDLTLVSASGHEREYAGAKLFLKTGAPTPAKTAFWLHLGANVAARDWHERGPTLLPLPSADPQRFLVVDKRLLPAARRAFKGQPGLEAPYTPDQLNDGELGEIAAAGYGPVAGVFGAHRFHHAEGDDPRCVEPALVEAAVGGFKALILDALGAA